MWLPQLRCVAVCRCATYQSSDGKWNKFGGRLAWDSSAICNNNPAWGGGGAHKTGDDYPAAPNIDHTQVRLSFVATALPAGSLVVDCWMVHTVHLCGPTPVLNGMQHSVHYDGLQV